MANQINFTLREHLSLIKYSITVAWKIDPLYSALKLGSSVVLQFVTLFMAYYIAYVVNTLTSKNGLTDQNVFIIVGLFLVIQIVSLTAQQISDISTMKMNSKGFYALDRMLYTALSNVPLSTVESPEFNNTYMRANEARAKILEAYNKIIDAVSNLTRIIALSVLLFPVLPLQIVILLISVIPRYMLVGNAIKRILRFTIGETENRKKNDVVAESLRSVGFQIEIRITQAFNYLNDKVKAYQTKYVDQESLLQTKRGITAVSLNFFNFAVIAWGLIITVQRYLQGATDLGSVTFVLSNLQSLSGSLNGIVAVFTNLLEQNVKCNDFRMVMDMQKDSLAVKHTLEYKNNLDMAKKKLSTVEPAKIEVKNITFEYPSSNAPVLKNVSLTINPGDKIAIVGHNGAGKTTLIKLLMKLYESSDGEITVNGLLLNDVPGTYWYKCISGLMQNYNVYQGLSVAENVYLGNTSNSMDTSKVESCLSKAGLSEDIERLSDKSSSIISPRFKGGVGLSTGQMQKLAIARFLYNDSPIVVFDEPTASIDAGSEAKIFDSIFESFKQKTVIIISHRFSTVRRAQKIVVIEHGEIVEVGSHKELIEADGFYAKSYKLQAEAYNKE